LIRTGCYRTVINIIVYAVIVIFRITGITYAVTVVICLVQIRNRRTVIDVILNASPIRVFYHIVNTIVPVERNAELRRILYLDLDLINVIAVTVQRNTREPMNGRLTPDLQQGLEKS
jgi:hypothetical protein